jgi:hypothetical protein
MSVRPWPSENDPIEEEPMNLSIPGTAELPADIQERIDHSVFQFESKFAGFGMLALARSSGWIEEFRKELVSLAQAVLEKK